MTLPEQKSSEKRLADQAQILIDFIKKQKPLLWVGAGLSISAGYPTLYRLADELWEEVGINNKPQISEPYQFIDELYRQYKGRTMSNALSKIIPTGRDSSFKPVEDSTASHDAIAQIAESNFLSAVFTTNYDELIETALNKRNVKHQRQVLGKNQFIPESQGKLRLMKIHGDVTDYQTTILSGKSYDTFQEQYNFLFHQIDAFLQQRPVLFLGCSIR